MQMPSPKPCREATATETAAPIVARQHWARLRRRRPPPPRSRAPSWLTLFLHRHFALRVLVGGQFLGAGRIAIIAEEKGREVHIGLCAELAGPVRRHQGVDISEQRRDVARAPMLAEVRTLERGAAELEIG